MSDPASALHDQFPEFLARLPAGLDLDALALETKAIQRRREVVDGAGLLRIALARGPGGLSLCQTAAWASLRGIAELSNPGVKYRLNSCPRPRDLPDEPLRVGLRSRPPRSRIWLRKRAESRCLGI